MPDYDPIQAWYALVIFEIQLLAVGIDIAIVSLLVRPIELSFHIHDVAFAGITAIPVAVGVAIGYYPAGLLADAIRRREMIAAGAVIWGVAAIIAAQANSETLFFIARLLAGIGTAVPGPAIFSMLTDAFPRTRRALAMSAYGAGASIGTGIGLAVCGALVVWTQHHGVMHLLGRTLVPWQQCFVAVAAMGAIIVLLVLTISEPSRKDRSAGASAGLAASIGVFGRYLRKHWILWSLFLISYPIGLTSYSAIASWGPTFGMRHYGADSASAIALLGIATAAGSLIGSVSGGFLAQRGINHGNPRIVPTMLLSVTMLFCVFATAFPFMPSWLLAVIGMGAVNATSFAVWVLLTIGIQETAPNEVRGQLLGILGFIAFIPQSLGATFVAFLASGVFAKTGGLTPALAVVGCATSIFAIVLYAFAGKPYEKAKKEMHAITPPSEDGLLAVAQMRH